MGTMAPRPISSQKQNAPKLSVVSILQNAAHCHIGEAHANVQRQDPHCRPTKVGKDVHLDAAAKGTAAQCRLNDDHGQANRNSGDEEEHR